MAWLGRSAAVAALALCASLLAAPPAQAVPSPGGWTFAGTISAPARTLTSVTATVAGTASVPAATLAAVGCDDTVAAPPQGVVALRNTGTSAIVALSGSGLTITSDTPVGVSATTSLGPGTYEVVLQYRCGSGSFRGAITPSTPVTVTIASRVSSRSITRSCLATVPETPCTSLSQQVSSVPAGYSVTFAGIIATTWSDSVVTEDPVTGTQYLQRYTGYTWGNVASNCATTLTINASDQYRCTSTSGGDHTAVAITTLQPTSNVRVGSVTATPSVTLKGEPILVQAPVLMTYGDGTQWPAPTSVTYKIEFQAAGTALWTTLVGPQPLDSRGNVSRTINFPGTGLIRVSAGSSTSSAFAITEAVPGNKFAFSLADFPATADPGQTISPSVVIGQEWTDGVVRTPVAGTEVKLEFAIAYTPTTTELTWSTVATGKTSSSTRSITISAVPQASGYWRFRAGDSVTASAYITVTGSRFVQLNGSMTPVSGSTPFAGTSTNYAFDVQIVGYVGTKDLSAFVDFGGARVKVGTVNRTMGVATTLSVKAPDKPGYVTPEFTVEDDQGVIWAKSKGTPILVDGLVTFEPQLLQPDPPPVDGQPMTFIAKMQGQTLSGATREGVWLKPPQLQRLVNGAWTAVADATSTSGSTAQFTTVAVKGGQYRVLDTASGSLSPVLALRVVVPTGLIRIGAVTVGSPRVEVGDSVQVTANVESEFDDGVWRPALDGEAILVFYVDAQGSRQVASVSTLDGVAVIDLKPKTPGQVIFETADGRRSDATPINVITPARFAVEWPKGVAPGKPLRVSFFVRASDGPRWRKPIVVLLQWKPFTSSSWTTLKKFSMDRGRPATASIPSPKAGNYRLFAPDFGFLNDASYG